MSTSILSRANVSALILAGLLGTCALASAGPNKPAPPPPPPKPAAAPAPRPAPPAARPSSNPGGGGMQRPSNGPSTYHPNPSGPSVNRPNTGGPSANQPSSGGPSANHPNFGGPSANRPNAGAPSANQPYSGGPSANRPNTGGPGAGPITNGGGGRNITNGSGPGTHIQPGIGRPAGFAGSTPHSTIRSSAPIAPRNSRELTARSGSAVRMRSDGRASDVHDVKRGMDIHHGLNGGHMVSVDRPDHSRTVYQKGRPGYVQRPYSYHNHEFAQRTYNYHGRSYSHSYYGYGYRGAYLHVYAPGMYYGPGFYGWAYNPWAAPITFGWGFGGSPWYGYYGYYFTPYSAYPSASYWLTDYMISSDLQTAYAAQQEAGEVDGAAPAQGGQPEMTPEVKQQIADEIRNQLALENQEATFNAHQMDVDPGSSGIDRMLSDAAKGKQHVFVVANALDVVDASQMECTLSDGDVLALQTSPPADSKAADLVVLSAKGGQECQKQAVVSIALEDLQEMQNHMRETIDQGLQELQAKQGKGGLPAVPSTVQIQATPAVYASIEPPPDPNAATEIQQQAQQADQAEKEVTAEATQPNGIQ